MDKAPQTWPPSARDCSQGYCSYYCPQWCFFFFPPPPPPPPPSSHPLLSPLLISVITVTSTAFVLVAYYLILTRYRARQRNRSSGPTLPPQNPASGFLTLGNGGLDDNLINKIRMYRYRKGGGSLLVLDGTDCSVCLGPFEDGDKIRLLPKCSHAFHQCCIDTWLKSHSNCPLCRACILPDLQEGRPESGPSESDAARVLRIEEINREVIEIGEGRGVIGRSFSMDSPFRRHEMDADADTDTHMNSRRWSRSLHSVMSPIRMKRSRSTRSVTTGRGRSAILPT